VIQAAQTCAQDEALILDAGFPLADLLSIPDTLFVVRGAKNFTARRNFLPAYPGKGRYAEYGEVVRPLARTYKGKTIPATAPDARVEWMEGEHTIQALLFNDLVSSDAKPGSPCFRCVVILDPRYHEPLVLVTNLAMAVEAQAVRSLYRDRWPVEQMPLAAKQMLGAARSFVFASQSRTRLPQLALLAGNVLSYVAATSAPVATGFWDRKCRPTCGRLRRALSRLHFSDLAVEALGEGAVSQVRKKASVTEHLRKGVQAHRRTKAVVEPLTARLAA
jgi:hypothetical protein